MLKRFVTLMVLAAAGVGLIVMAGCETEGQTGATLGAVIGAGVGQLAGGDTEATLIGGAVGAGAGYILGNESEKKKAKAREQVQVTDTSENTVTVWITNSDGSQTSVKLKKEGSGYIGPSGEPYASLPSEEELKKRYGK